MTGLRMVGRLAVGIVLLGAASTAAIAGALDARGRAELLAAREAVWRAWFANDQERLRQLLPEDTLAINTGDGPWEDRAAVLAGAARFAGAGGRLVRLEFPRTEVQEFGEVAVLYSRYELETETAGKRETTRGRATEVFVRRRGRWLNPGWHMDSGR